MSNFTLDVAQQIAIAATGPRKKLPFATNEEVLSVLQEAEAAHDEAVSDFEDINEDTRQKQLLLDFAPAVRKVFSLWRELAVPGRQTILWHCEEACLEDDAVRLRLEAGETSGIERELLLEFLPAYAEASLEPRIRRARDAAREITNKSVNKSHGETFEWIEETVETRVRLPRPFSFRDKRWKIYDIALKRLQRGAELAVEELEGRGRHRPKELAGLEAFTSFIAKAWITKPAAPSVAKFSSKFDYVSSADGRSEYKPISPAAKFIWKASKHLPPPYVRGDFFEPRAYTVQNCETVMDYVTGALRGEKLAANS